MVLRARRRCAAAAARPRAARTSTSTTPSDWRTVGLLLVGVFVANVAAHRPLGWVITGALLFWGCAFALGSRHHVRDLADRASRCRLVTFYGFYIGLGIHLPAGVLEGML